MGEASAIEWTDDTFNPWWGCARISPGCRNCYAADNARRWGHDVFHLGGERRMFSDAYWRKPLKWNREAQQNGIPRRVFCASMADVFEDHPQVISAREQLWELIEQTPWLRWQLLTKRPENVAAMAPWKDTWPDHVWLGVSVEDQRRADERIPVLLQTKARIRFLSCEPLVEQIDLTLYLAERTDVTDPYLDAPEGAVVDGMERVGDHWIRRSRIGWVIAGGESGPKARPMDPLWPRALKKQCQIANVPYLFKQWGEWAPSGYHVIRSRPVAGRVLVGEPVDDAGHRIEMVRLGKKRAGRLLDGELHDGVPSLLAPALNRASTASGT
jgi:protein gp37